MSKQKPKQKKSRQLIDKERWAESEKDAYEFLYSPVKSVTAWFAKMTGLTIIMTIVGIALLNMNSFVGQLVLVFPLCTTVFIAHELTHIITAKILGYSIKWYPINIAKIPIIKVPLTMQGFDVIFPTREAMDRHRWLIGITPYLIVFPLSASFILQDMLAFKVAGIILLCTHLFSLCFEAKRV